MYTLIHSEDQIREFHSFMNPLEDGEAYFVSLSARGKYLNEEEKKEFNLNRAEMFARKLVKNGSFSDYLRVLRQYEVNDGGYTTKNGMNVPSKCLVVYANINASSGMKALKEFNSRMNDLMFENTVESRKRFSGLDSELMNCYQRSFGVKHLLDVDFDVEKNVRGYEMLYRFLKELNENKVEWKVIETHGGYHVLIKRETLKYNYTKILKELDLEARKEFGKAEIVVNSNSMIPIPGTYQAGFAVRFIEP